MNRRATTWNLLAALSLTVLSCAGRDTSPKAIDPAALMSWSLLGRGEVAMDPASGAVRLAEEDGSRGVTLLCPTVFAEDVALRYSVKPLNDASVLVVMLGIADTSGSDLVIPDGYDGSIGLWTKGSRNLFFAFHNAAHGRRPFVRLHPLSGPAGSTDLAEGPANLMTTQWHDVEAGRRDGEVWLRIDGEQVLSAQAPARPGAGRVALRLRGTSSTAAACLIRDVRINSP